MENEQKNEALVSLVNNDEEIIIQFADGQKIIPDGIIADLGKDYFIQRAEVFVGINYADFYAHYHKTVEKRQLNQYQNEFVASHFGNLF